MRDQGGRGKRWRGEGGKGKRKETRSEELARRKWEKSVRRKGQGASISIYNTITPKEG